MQDLNAITGWIIVAIAACWLYFGYHKPERYAAEVGYYRGEEIAYDLWGDFDSLDDCRNQAIARYNFYAVDQKGRGYAWSCLLKNGKGGYTSRHR